ncbi:polyphenol oxidase family protein, partial [uncultured Muribaculum sp.]
GIANVTLSEMLANGADISCIQVAMGPCICSRCFEVGDEVASQFPASCVTRNLATGKPHVDLAAYLRQSLIEAGIKENNITMPPSCTRCNPSQLFSARVLGINSGRIFTFIMQHPLPA